MTNDQTAKQRLRLTFAKGEAVKYISHLDLARTWERVFRRVGLPLAYSQGYNPRPRFQIAAALPEDVGADFLEKVRLATYARVYRMVPAQRSFAAAKELEELDRLELEV